MGIASVWETPGKTRKSKRHRKSRVATPSSSSHRSRPPFSPAHPTTLLPPEPGPPGYYVRPTPCAGGYDPVELRPLSASFHSAAPDGGRPIGGGGGGSLVPAAGGPPMARLPPADAAARAAGRRSQRGRVP